MVQKPTTDVFSQPMDQSHQKPANASSTPDMPESHKICIIGAGVSGLYIAMILDDLDIPGVEYQILEASSRIGGRIYTHHFSDAKNDYYDVGAARFLCVPPMRRVFHLFEKTEVPLAPYCLDGGVACPKYFNGKFFKGNEFDPHRVSRSNGGSVPDDVVAGCRDLLENVYAPFKQHLAADFAGGMNEILKADDYSIQQYLQCGGPNGSQRKFDFPSIQWMETQLANTLFYERAFHRGVLKSYLVKDDAWWCIKGGSEVLTQTMHRFIRNKVETEARVTAIALESNDTQSTKLAVWVDGESQPRREFDTVFSTSTLGALSRIDLSGLGLSASQRDAIRSMPYRNSAKVALKFKYPWWTVHCGIHGGMATTDLPLRVCVYPSGKDPQNTDEPAILIASYTQGYDADRIASLIHASSLDEKPLIDLLLRDLAKLHSTHVTYDLIKEAYAGEYHAYSWNHDNYSCGAYASFGPSQLKYLLPCLSSPAAGGRFHIVGEAVSFYQGWVLGSLESAYGAVHRFLRQKGMLDVIEKLERNWGLGDGPPFELSIGDS